MPHPGTNNRRHAESAGKALGGGTVINYGGWMRADGADYDEWANAVEDQSWRFEAWVPFFKRSETFLGRGDVDERLRGMSGPVHVSTASSDPDRVYPLREPIRRAFEELGITGSGGVRGRLLGLRNALGTGGVATGRVVRRIRWAAWTS